LNDIIWMVVKVLVAIDLISLVALWALLKWRKVSVYRTRFGLAMVFDSLDAEGDEIRLLNVNGTFQSISYTGRKEGAAGGKDGEPAATGDGRDHDTRDDPDTDPRFEPVCAYHQYFAEVIDMLGPNGHAGAEGLGDALVIGGGGYSFPKWLVAHCPQAHVDVAEIDPKVVDIAHRHFFLRELEARYHAEARGRLDTHVTDGWAYLQEGDRRWQVIVNDAFRAKRPLGELTGAEGARRIHDHLAPGGVYLANLLCPREGKGSEPLRTVVEAFSGEFAYTYLFPEWPDDPTRGGANAFVATDRRLPIAGRYLVSERASA